MTDVEALARLGRARATFFLTWDNEGYYVPRTSQILNDLADALEELEQENTALKQVLEARIT